MNTTYLKPYWSSNPIHECSLEIIKDGTIVSEQTLSEKDFFIIGREKAQVDIHAENPTTSRQHAVLQFKDNGDCFIYDLESTHGTFLNKKKIEALKYYKLSNGD